MSIPHLAWTLSKCATKEMQVAWQHHQDEEKDKKIWRTLIKSDFRWLALDMCQLSIWFDPMPLF